MSKLSDGTRRVGSFFCCFGGMLVILFLTLCWKERAVGAGAWSRR